MKLVCVLVLAFCLACTDEHISVENLSQQDDTYLAANGLKIKRKITADRSYKPGNKCVGGVAVYNEREQLIEEYDFSSCENLFKKVIYSYSDSGQVTSTIESDLEHVQYRWNFNEKGQLVEQIASEPTLSFQYKLEYKYDDLGNLIEYKGTMADGRAYHGTSRKEYTYEDGLKTWTNYFSGIEFNEPGYRIHHIYDDSGKEIMNHIYKNPLSRHADTTYIYYEYY